MALAQQQEIGVEVDGHDLVPEGGLEVRDRRAGREDAGVEDQQVQSAELPDGLLQCRGQGGLRGQVADDAMKIGPLVQLRNGGIDVEADHGRAAFEQ